jgi:anti-sigma B factor antagonist
MPDRMRLPGVCAPPKVIRLPAEIDVANARSIGEGLAAAFQRGVTTVVADMSATTFCDCAGVSMLERARLRAAANQGELRLVVSSPAVWRVFVLTGLDLLLPVYSSVTAALAARPPGNGGPLPRNRLAAGLPRALQGNLTRL